MQKSEGEISEMSILRIIYHSKKDYIETGRDMFIYFYRWIILLGLLLTLPIMAPMWAYLLRKEAHKAVEQNRPGWRLK